MLALAAGLSAGCGSDDEDEGAPIPQQAAADLESRLAEVERRLDAGGEGACADIQDDTKPAVESIVASLPSDVDADVRDALQESFDRLFQLSEQQCDEEEGQETEAEPPPVIETETETTETVPPEEDEEDEEDDEEESPPTEVPPETPPGQDGELPPGQGGDNPGQGNGGGAIVPGEDD
jgi:hypothetical protein